MYLTHDFTLGNDEHGEGVTVARVAVGRSEPSFMASGDGQWLAATLGRVLARARLNMAA